MNGIGRGTFRTQRQHEDGLLGALAGHGAARLRSSIGGMSNGSAAAGS
jgi:hypothetical protein